jgi:hypothetical protein
LHYQNITQLYALIKKAQRTSGAMQNDPQDEISKLEPPGLLARR